MAVKVIEPTPMLAEAADVLAPVQRDVVVIGASALEVALADDHTTAISPTRDVDGFVSAERAEAVIAELEAADLRRSDVPHERGFTWIRGELKVQLVRGFHPFVRPPVSRLPENPALSVAGEAVHQVEVAFTDHPDSVRLTSVNAACLLALKQAAFGRTRPPDNQVVERDFHDAHLLISRSAEELLTGYESAEYAVRQGVRRAVDDLAAGEEATRLAARQAVALGEADSQRHAEALIRRAAARIRPRLG